MAGSARRYARAVFELAQEEGGTDGWAQRLETVRELFALPEVRAVLTNPTIGVQRRQDAVVSMLGERSGQEGVNLARLLVAAGRVDTVDAIQEEYQRLSDEAVGRVQATATTAVELTGDERQTLARDLSGRLGREVRLQARVDPSILGGLVVQVGDRVIDASVRTRLRQLRQRLAGA